MSVNEARMRELGVLTVKEWREYEELNSADRHDGPAKDTNMKIIVLPARLVSGAGRKEPFFARAVGTVFDLRASSGAVVIDLYDEIGAWGVSAAAFREKLNSIGDADIHLRINSPGGDVFDGIAMYNDLLSHKGKVTVEITGLAASAASIIALAGEEITMHETAFMMIHNAWGIAVGDRHKHTETAALLGQIDNALAQTYASRSGMTVRAAAEMMDAETWLTAEAAFEQKFIDIVIKPAADEGEKAAWDLSVYSNVPRDVRVAIVPEDETIPEMTTLRDVERVLARDAGSRSKGRGLLIQIRTILEKPVARDADGDTSLVAEMTKELEEFVKKIKRSSS